MPAKSSAIDTARVNTEAATEPAQTPTANCLSDDVQWLEQRVQVLLGGTDARDRKLAGCYLKLLRQRRRQLAFLARGDDPCPGCWHDYLF